MAYITVEAMTHRYGDEIAQLLDRDIDENEDAGVFDAVEADAAALINGYLATRYTLPLASTPPLVAELAAEITRYKLWGAKAPEEVRKRYEDALSRLKDIAKGLITLIADDLPATGLGVAHTERTRTFDDDTLADYVGI